MSISVLCPSIEQLVQEIEAAHAVWQQVRTLFGENSTMAVAYRELKICRQVRLLRQYAPEYLYLVLDTPTEDTQAEGEAMYSLRLKQPIAGRQDADFLLVRVVQKVLTLEEIQHFQQH